jgi:CHAT domain-containing protein
VAYSLNFLGELYRKQGDYNRALPRYLRALAIRQRVLKQGHPEVAPVLNNLALLYRAKGDYARAIPLFRRALAIYRKNFGPYHRGVGTVLNNLAGLYQEQNDYARARPLFQRALKIAERTEKPESPILAIALNNLALLYIEQGDYVRAMPLFKRALEIRQKALRPDHPDIAQSLNNLALVHYYQGDYSLSIQLIQQALSIWQEALGPEHPLVARAFNNLAALHQAQGDYRQAIIFRQLTAEVHEKNINVILNTGSQQQKQSYLNTLSGETAATVSLHARDKPQDTDAARLAITTILRRKGRVLDAFTSQLDALRRRATREDKKLLDDLVAIQSQLANLQLGGSNLARDVRRAEVRRLTAEQERLEDAVSRRSVEFRAVRQPVTLESVQAAVPTETALVELFVYKPFNAKAKSFAERFGAPRYVAYVVHGTETALQFEDLGEAVSMDAAATQFRNALKSPKTSKRRVEQLARDLDARLMQPIRKLLGNTRRVLLAPDGALNLIPFESLVDENGHYLIENYSFDYLTSGRDLLRLQVTSASETGTFIVANPRFDLTRPVVNCRRNQRGFGLASRVPDAKVGYRGADLAHLCYSTLAGTAQEAAALVPFLRDAQIWAELDATEGALKSLHRPRILHIATHGYFLPDQSQRAGAPQGENALLRSGLILAGVNQRSSGPDQDGVLTALEVAGLDLFGTKLVVLSACETALGDVQNGQGVYGLRRALVLAGSETQIMSLWKVSDDATRALMVAYYKRLQAGEGRIAAMRAVQLEMLRGQLRAGAKGRTRGTTDVSNPASQRDYRHPYYWAAFIQSGDWRSLGGK